MRRSAASHRRGVGNAAGVRHNVGMPAAATKLTIDKYAKLPPPADGKWELRHGELAKVTFPKYEYYRLQDRLVWRLRAIAGENWFVGPEFPFRPFGEHELWAADVAVVARDRYLNIEDWLADII